MTSFIASDPDLLEIGSFSIYSHSTHSSVVVHILLLKYMHLECKGSPRGGGGVEIFLLPYIRHNYVLEFSWLTLD